jgi:hypothetical protein
LLKRLLALNPKDRLSAKEALNHSFFDESGGLIFEDEMTAKMIKRIQKSEKDSSSDSGGESYNSAMIGDLREAGIFKGYKGIDFGLGNVESPSIEAMKANFWQHEERKNFERIDN